MDSDEAGMLGIVECMVRVEKIIKTICFSMKNVIIQREPVVVTLLLAYLY